MEEYNRPNKSPNPEGRFTLFPGKDDPKTFTLTPGCHETINDLAGKASAAVGKTISRSDIVEACVMRVCLVDDIIGWITEEAKRRDEQAAGTAEGGPAPAVRPAGP